MKPPIALLLDVLAIVAGVGLVVAGVARWSVPAAYIVAGVALVAAGFLPNRRPRRS